MFIYDGIKEDFLVSCSNMESMALKLRNSILDKMGRHTPDAEFRSWENSLYYMSQVLSDQEIPGDVGIAIEYNIPQTSKRIDFMISGYDKDGISNIIIVELKQWERLHQVQGTDALVETCIGGHPKRVVHPSYQAWSYAQLISDFNTSVQNEKVKLHPCACLHNYTRCLNDPLDAVEYQEYLEKAPAYTKGQAEELRSFIKSIIEKGDNRDGLHLMDCSEIRPSKSLQNSIASMLQGNQEFIMLDEQKVAYDEIFRLSKLSQQDGRKRTVIVQGGPGTGKSVIAVNLLAELAMKGQSVQYITKNSAPRQVYMNKLKGNVKGTSVANLFKSSGSYVNTRENAFAMLLADDYDIIGLSREAA